MNKIFVLLLLIVLLLTVLLSGCEELDKRFIGTWIPERMEYPTFTFYSDKKYSIEEIDGTWDVVDNKLILKHGNNIEKYNFKFSGDNYLLTLTEVNEGIDRFYMKEI